VVAAWSAAGEIHYNFLQPDQTITAESHCKEIDEIYRKHSHQFPTVIYSANILLTPGIIL